MKEGNIFLVIDGQAGSCGKGKFVGYFTIQRRIQLAINNNMANSGHTFIFDNGDKVQTTHLPISVVYPYTTLCIGPAAAINPNTLEKEIIQYKDLIGKRKIYIHPRATIILERHVETEKQTIRSGSTLKGCAAAQCEKMMRNKNDILAKDFYSFNHPVIELMDTSDIIHDFNRRNESIMIETSQGFDLDIDYGLDYPHTTSRECTVSSNIAFCGIPPTKRIISYMVFRPYPIRISNSTDLGFDIYSGDYAGSKEISWDLIKQRCGAPDNVEISELTTVTKKIRRVFDFNFNRFKKSIEINDPTYLILNFSQYLNFEDYRMNNVLDISQNTLDFVSTIEKKYKKKVAFIGTGPSYSDIVDTYVDRYQSYYRGCASL